MEMEAQAASISFFITAYTLTRYTQRRGGNRNRHERWQKIIGLSCNKSAKNELLYYIM